MKAFAVVVDEAHAGGGMVMVATKTLPRELVEPMNAMERWQKSRKRFWVYGEARMHLFTRVPDRCGAAIVFEDGAHMIRGRDGDYLLNEDRMGLPVPRDFEIENKPKRGSRKKVALCHTTL